MVYWLNIAICGASILACVVYTERAGLIKPDAPEHFLDAFRRRVILAQALYAVGAIVGLYSIPLGIGFIVLIQLNYVIAPRLPWLWKF